MLQDAEALRVLAIDDNPEDLKLLQRALDRVQGFRIDLRGVTTMDEAQTAIDHCVPFDVVFLDYRLGAIDGMEALRRLRDQGLRIPVLVLTGMGDERTAARVRRQGASDYLSKDDLSPATLSESLRYVMDEYHRQRRHSRALREALTDGLTGLLVKEYFMRRAEEEVSRAIRHGTPLSCLMFDLDHFKSVNDTYGHLAGDEVIRHAAQVLRSKLRTSDLAGRFGGEEMCVLLPGTAVNGALVLAERCRLAIEALRISWRGVEVRVTTSVGAAALAGTAATARAMLMAADDALYQAKRDGRNCVRLAGAADVGSGAKPSGRTS